MRGKTAGARDEGQKEPFRVLGAISGIKGRGQKGFEGAEMRGPSSPGI